MIFYGTATFVTAIGVIRQTITDFTYCDTLLYAVGSMPCLLTSTFYVMYLFFLLFPLCNGETCQLSLRCTDTFITFSIVPCNWPFLSIFLRPMPVLYLSSHNHLILAVVFLVFCNLLVSMSLIFSGISRIDSIRCMIRKVNIAYAFVLLMYYNIMYVQSLTGYLPICHYHYALDVIRPAILSVYFFGRMM